MNIKKILKYIILAFFVILIIIQFIRPERLHTDEVNSDDITKQLNIPGEVQGILKRSCYDCHSNQTYWPWYSNISPVSWLVADDVTKGRKKMNFSEWGKMPESKRELRLENLCDQVKEGEMPLPKYLLLHKDKTLTDQEKDLLCKWSQDEKKKMEGE